MIYSPKNTVLILLLYITVPLIGQRWTLEDDFSHIKIFDSVLKKTVSELVSIEPVKKDQKEYFTNKQHDQIEKLYFRYTLCTKSLIDIVNAYRDFASQSKYNNETFFLGYCAALILYKYSADLIIHTSSNPVLANKLNEEYPRSNIKSNSLDDIINKMTSPEYINNLDITNEFFHREISNNNNNYDNNNKIRKELIDFTTVLSNEYNNYKITVLNKFTLLPLAAAEIMQVNVIENTVNTMIETAGGQLKAIQEFIFTLWGDIRMPLVDGIKFSKKQKKKFKNLLKPGDIILTYSSGYLSNIFLPGYFKHVLVYTGYQDYKKNKYLSSVKLRPEQKNLISNDNNIIESVSEGVITNNIEKYLDGYADRLLIFRPNLDDNEIVYVMERIHSYLGTSYDFDFDLSNGEKQTCSELVYRSYNGIGSIDIELEEIYGTTTLSSEHLLRYFINDGQSELILLAVEKENKPGKTTFLKKDQAEEYLKSSVYKLLDNK